MSQLQDDSLEARWPANTNPRTAEVTAPFLCLSLPTGMSVAHSVMLGTERRVWKLINTNHCEHYGRRNYLLELDLGSRGGTGEANTGQ